MSPLVVTPGDPQGIGPEITCKALCAAPREAIVLGETRVLEQTAERLGLTWPSGVRLVQPDGDEPVEVSAIRQAAKWCQTGRARALVTGPINKEKLISAGFAFTGHTDFLGHLCGADPVMAFVGGQLRVALVTVHLPLRQVPHRLSVSGIRHTIEAVHGASQAHLGLDQPRIAVCGLNPHAGDGGVLGTEDRDIVAPAVEQARSAGIDARGPISAETAFRDGMAGRVDWIVAMYHDQGLAPLKVVDFGRSVNWTLGLPIVRTSVDHGTAYDIAGSGEADPTSMEAALSLAERLTVG